MSETVSFKVPKRVKDEMDKLKSRIDWAEELRRHIIDVVEREKRDEAFSEVAESLKKSDRRMCLRVFL